MTSERTHSWRLARKEALSGGWAVSGMLPELGSLLEVGELDLAPGDVLLLYTDGITEATDPGGEAYGLDRLIALLRQMAREGIEPRTIAQAVIADVTRFSPVLADDVSVLAIRRRADA